MKKTSEAASARWERIIHQQESGGWSIAEFCRRRGLSQPSFFAWRRRLRTSGKPHAAFVELKVASAQGPEAAAGDGAALELLLAGGRFRGRVLVRAGFDRQTLRELLAALEEPA